jgi:DNA-binding beta-propeller fold protein YncE
VLPQLRKLEAEFGDQLAVIGVHSPKFPAEQLTENVRQAVLRNDIDHPVVNDVQMAVWQSYGVNAWPTMMFIDPRGRVFGTHAGEFDYDQMRGIIAGMLEEYAGEGLLDPGPLPVQPEPDASGVLRYPGKVLADPAGDRLFAADSGHHQVLIVDMHGTVVRRFGAGEPGLLDGDTDTARFTNPQGMALSPDQSLLYVADAGNHALRQIDLATGVVTTLAGTGARGYQSSGGTDLQTSLASPWDLAWHGDSLWVAMAGMHQIWGYDPTTGLVKVVAGTGVESIHDGPLLEATFAQPMGLCELNGIAFIADSESSAVRQIDPGADRVRRLVGRGLFHFGDLDARGDSVRLQHVQGVDAIVIDGEPAVYLTDTYNNKIKRLDPGRREVVTVAGGVEHGCADGTGEDALFWEPTGISIANGSAYIADTNNHAIRRLDLETGEVGTVVGEKPARR